MSLPSGQQRVLDDIEVALQASEPRLASMYAIFTRLTRNEARPRREELPAGRGLHHGALRGFSVRPMLRALTPRRSRPLSRAVVLAEIIAVLVALGVLLGLTVHTARGACPRGRGVHASLTYRSPRGCQMQAGFPGYPMPAK
jgi:hypothetical protein